MDPGRSWQRGCRMFACLSETRAHKRKEQKEKEEEDIRKRRELGG